MKANKRLLIVAVIIGLITVLALNQHMKAMQSEVSAFAGASQISVVVAESTIPQHTRITSEMLTTELIPEDAVHPEALTSIDEAVGGISRSDIVKGEQVLGSRIATEKRRASLSYRIPEQLRGISIPVSEVSGVSGYISPGDRVDVIVAYDDREINETKAVYTVAQNVLVLATGEYTQEQDNEEKQLVSTVTLGVTPGQAEVLAYANQWGTFHLTLRSPLDENIVELDCYSAENFESFRKR